MMPEFLEEDLALEAVEDLAPIVVPEEDQAQLDVCFVFKKP
jgi:hypothetical protein